MGVVTIVVEKKKREAPKKTGTAWLVSYGTLTTLVRGEETRRGAYMEFLRVAFPYENPSDGRLMPPTEDEVVIRKLRPEDAEWIEQYKSKPFNAALNELRSAADAEPHPQFDLGDT